MSKSVLVSPKKFLTNQGENTLGKRLETILPKTRDFDCLVGYFFISGFFRLYPKLESVKKIRIPIGLKNEQVIYGLLQIAHDTAPESVLSSAEIKRIFGGMLRDELIQARDSLPIETGVHKFIEWIRSGKLTVKLTRLPKNANSLYDIGFHSLVEWWYELATGRVSRLGVGRCTANPPIDQAGGRPVGPADEEHTAGLRGLARDRGAC